MNRVINDSKPFPHNLEGSIWQDEIGGTAMYCQVGYSKYALINLETGNRLNEAEEEAITTGWSLLYREATITVEGR